ncbi:MAG: ABC transporter substrate-binding protein [Spirochaetaceae bacterium]|nr:ABC transporter substrate-binding protein [Spirochaetaceae bacterium]
MNRARTLLILATLCALAAAPLFATGEEETSTASAAADNPWTDGQDLSGSTVNVFGAFVDVDAERFDASMAPFEEQTGIDIVYEGSGDFESLVVIRAEGGDPPDIAAFPQPGLMADMVRRGFIVDLSESFSMDYLQQQYSDAWIDLSRVDDTIAGVWYRASLKILVWYAKPVFEAEGYEIPETWDDLVALSEQMVADGHVPWSIGIESSGATG